MKWIIPMLSFFSLCSCSLWPASTALLSTATAGASALTGHGMTIECNVMSKNNTCNCGTCKK